MSSIFEKKNKKNIIKFRPYGNSVLGWTKEGFEKAEDDTKENKVRKTSTDKIDSGKTFFMVL